MRFGPVSWSSVLFIATLAGTASAQSRGDLALVKQLYAQRGITGLDAKTLGRFLAADLADGLAVDTGDWRYGSPSGTPAVQNLSIFQNRNGPVVASYQSDGRRLTMRYTFCRRSNGAVRIVDAVLSNPTLPTLRARAGLSSEQTRC